MGMFWKVMRNPRIPPHALVLEGERGTLSRKWPLLWRIAQYRYVLKVVGTTMPHQAYYLYVYNEGSRVIRYHQLIHTPYVSVRVGPKRCAFWAETRTHEPLGLTYTGNKEAGLLVIGGRNETKLQTRLSLTYI